MTRKELLAMMRANRYAIQASVSSTASPQAAVVGVIVTDDFELFFDTLDTTRKMRNLRQNPIPLGTFDLPRTNLPPLSSLANTRNS